MNYNLHMDIEKEIDNLLATIFNRITPLYSERSKTPFFLKGSCSLNRGLEIIDRVSHDIDLTYSLDLLGLNKISPSMYRSRSKTELAAKEFDTKCIDFNSEMVKQFKSFNYMADMDRDNPLIIKIKTPRSSRVLLLETGARSLDQKPLKVRVEAETPYQMYITPPEQSLMERVFGIHSDIILGKTNLNHLKFMYDIIMINRRNPKYIYNRALLNRVSDFNYIYYRWNREVCESIKTSPIELIPDSNKLDLYHRKWETISHEFISGQLPFSFNTLINELRDIKNILNKC